MSRNLHRLLVLILLFAAYFLTRLIKVAVRRRRRRALTVAHNLPRPPRRQMPDVIIAFVAFNMVGIAACFAGAHYLAPTLDETNTLLVIVGGLILFTIPSLYLLGRHGRDPIVTRADSLERTGRRTDAIALLESTLATTAATASRHAALGLLFSRDHRLSDAERSFACAADLDPSNPNYPIYRSVALCELSRPAEALALLDLSRDEEAREHLRQADELLCAFPEVQLTGFANPLLQLCRSRLDPSTRAFPVHTPPIP